MKAPSVQRLCSTLADAKGLDFYYQSKIDQLEQKLREKRENLLRLNAQRNELNTQGTFESIARMRGHSRQLLLC